VEAHIAFLDEVFKANSSILNALLGVINERVYHEAGQAIPVPLLSLFGASNETPEDNGLGALYDRFLLRVVVPPLPTTTASGSCSISSLPQPVRASPSMSFGTHRSRCGSSRCRMRHGRPILTIKHELEHEGLAASDRRWQACARLVRAKAWLEGDTETTSEHAEVLVYALWSEPRDIRVVERVVGRVANPLNVEAVELEDAARDLYEQRPAPDHAHLTQALEPLLRQLSDIHTRLEQRVATVPERRSFRARQALNRVEGWHRALSQLALRGLSRLHMAPGAG
jgi:MoxR-like ATPase